MVRKEVWEKCCSKCKRNVMWQTSTWRQWRLLLCTHHWKQHRSATRSKRQQQIPLLNAKRKIASERKRFSASLLQRKQFAMRDLIAAMKVAQAAVTTEHSSTVESEAKHETTAEADVKVTLLDSEEMKWKNMFHTAKIRGCCRS